MNTFQKVIKYLAIALAIIITVGILTGVVNVISGVVAIFDGEEVNRIDFSENFTEVSQLDINPGLGKLIVKVGDGFQVEATNVSEKFRANVVNGTLVVDDSHYRRRFLWFDFGTPRIKSIITVYVPEDFIAKRIKIDSGVGEVILEELRTDSLIIDAGVGDLKGHNLTAMRVNANGGVGNMNFSGVRFTDVDFDCGVGNISIDGTISGKSVFDCGIGEVSLDIRGNRDDYALRIDAGLGSIRVDGDKVSGEYKDTFNADNTIRIDGGIGNVNIVFNP